MSMNLPKAIKNMIKPIESLKVVNDHPESLPQISKKVDDVEYEDDYEDGFNGIASMSHQTVEEIETKAPEIRDYSISEWNHSPGLARWGFDDSDAER